MKLKYLEIRRFRGISKLNWTPDGTTICLVGPGDSTKTTILEAVEWVLSPHWSLPASDADFYGAVITEPILIEATIGELPESLLSDQKFGLHQRGWGSQGLRDEPSDDDESVITVRLTIDDSLEPRWEVVNDRQEPRLISARDRESLGATRFGSDERHLSWGRRSALLRMTDSTEEMARTLATAHRTARDMVNKAELTELNSAAERASQEARALGAGSVETYRPALDPGAAGVGASGLSLHDGPIPVRVAGLGSRRLTSLAVQRASFPEGAIVMADEVETGLEPHRLRHLVRLLRTVDQGQALMTTHSEITVVELTTRELRVVASQGGTTTVQAIPEALQGAVRSAPEAMLGRRVIVCEGKTEVGLCRALDHRWGQTHGAPPAHIGLVLVPGEGTSAPSKALAFAELGYRTALLVDSDATLNPSEAEIMAGGVRVFAWDGEVSTEQRVILDVPWPAVEAIIDAASELFDEEVPRAVSDAIGHRLGAEPGRGLEEWLKSGFEANEIRRAVGQTAKAQGWFKRTDLGEALGNIVADALPQMDGTDLATKLNSLAEWAYA